MASFLDDYQTVAERLETFWSDHPTGRVWTELKLMGEKPGEVVVVWAAVFKEASDPDPWASGIAHQRILGAPPTGRQGKPIESAPEWTSPYEVCETSAIGRALANAGYATKGKRASKDEMSKADSANELFDITSWIEPLDDEQKAALRSWWKSEDGPHAFGANAVPGAWLDVVANQIKTVVQAEKSADV